MKGSLWWAFLLVMFALAVATGRGTLATLALMLAFATLVSMRWGRNSLSRVTYQRQLAKSHLSYGEESTLALEIVNAKALPLAWLIALDTVPLGITLTTATIERSLSGDVGYLTTAVSLRWYERVRHTHQVTGSHRGRFELGPVELSSADIFGFHRSYRTDPQIDYLTVYPKIVPVAELGLPAGRPVGEWLGRRRIIEDPLRFAAVREYRAGDNPRHIHWPASARTTELQVKMFEPSDTVSLMLAVDVQTSTQAYAMVSDHLELVISAAASLAVDALGTRYMVGLFLNSIGDRGERWMEVPPGRHERQLPDLLATLAGADAFRGAPFVDMLHAMRVNLPYGASIIAISATPNEDVYQALSMLQEAGHPVLLLTVGDMPPLVPERLETQHLGGSDAWQHLETL